MKPRRIRPNDRRPALPAAVLLALLVVCAMEGLSGRGLSASTLPSQRDSGRTRTPASSPTSPYNLRWIPDTTGGNRVIVEVTGLSVASLARLVQSTRSLAAWQRVLPVYVDSQGTLNPTRAPILSNLSNLPPVLGLYRVQAGALRFESQFPGEPGAAYRAYFLPDRLPKGGGGEGRTISSRHQFPARRPGPLTRVEQVYPSADLLPENLLKFYLHFSAPMSRGRIYDHIHLLDDAGKAIELPFLEIDEELWDDAMMRLTLFIDPGRIKRGVLPLEDVGPALEEGKRYTLVIDGAWKDGAGNPLTESYRKSFRVGPPDRDPPDPAQWRVQAPGPGTRQPLAVSFPEAMDHALAQRVIHVTDDAGKTIDGQVDLSDQERRWRFAPRDPWLPGTYNLVIQTTIEDLAGNNIGKPFDVDLFEGVQRRLTTVTVKLPFAVR